MKTKKLKKKLAQAKRCSLMFEKELMVCGRELTDAENQLAILDIELAELRNRYNEQGERLAEASFTLDHTIEKLEDAEHRNKLAKVDGWNSCITELERGIETGAIQIFGESLLATLNRLRINKEVLDGQEKSVGANS